MTHWWKRTPNPAERRSTSLSDLTKRVLAGRAPSVHSAHALSLPLLLEALEDTKTPYVLCGIPGHGYILRAVPSMTGFTEAEKIARTSVRTMLNEEEKK